MLWPEKYHGISQSLDEATFHQKLRALPLHAGAGGLGDDVALLDGLVITVDTLIEGVHFLPSDPAPSVAWKLLAVNLSDLAAKGAVPEGVLLSYPLGDEAWDATFVDGLADALSQLGCGLLGGDTVTLPAGAPRVLGITAFGRPDGGAIPRRSGAKAGDALWVTGTIGDAGAGLAIARGAPGPERLLQRYRRPQPRLREGRLLAPHVSAMMDVSDGLLIDAARMAAASGLRVTIDLAQVPLSADLRAWGGDALAAATAGDDYELLFAAPADRDPPVPATRVGSVAPGSGIALLRDGAPVPLPAALGWQHGGLR
jgi:thiamine-monophosphate kinase